MERAEALRPLSRDHHVALEVALRLRRCEDEASAAAAAERFTAFFAADGERHFEQEEALLLPELGGHPEEAERLRREHAAIRAAAARLDAGRAPVPDLHALGEALTGHVRWEERTLFPLLEAELDPERIAAIGDALGH